MGFDALLGNEQLKENLSAARRKGRLSHFYLLSGPRGSGKHTLADLIAAAMLCAEPDGPCGVCRSCRKILGGSHPDYITVDAPDKKIIPVQLVRDIRADVYIKPNEGARKIYLFPRAQDLNTEGQNTLLKILEEPPSYGVFLLLTDNPEKLLPTVRSRCVELKLRALPEELLRTRLRAEFPEADGGMLESAIRRSGGYLGQARELLSGGGLPRPLESPGSTSPGQDSRHWSPQLRLPSGLEKTEVSGSTRDVSLDPARGLQSGFFN